MQLANSIALCSSLALVQILSSSLTVASPYHMHGFMDRPWIGSFDFDNNEGRPCIDIHPIEEKNNVARPKIQPFRAPPIGHYRYDCQDFERKANTSIKIFWGTGPERVRTIVAFKKPGCPTPHNKGHTMGNMSLDNEVAQIFHQSPWSPMYDCYRDREDKEAWGHDWKSVRAFYGPAWDTDEST